MAKRRFNGRIALDVRDSKPDWSAFEPPRAREGAPNILYIVWDDVGFGAFDCYGGLIETPNLSRIGCGTACSAGPARLFIDGKEVARERIKTQPGFFGLEGVVTVGRDTGRPASDDYVSPDPFRGVVVEKVTVAVKGKPHSDPATQAAQAMSRD